MGTTELAAERPHAQPPPPAKRPGLLVRPSGDGLCQRTRDGIKPSVARGAPLCGGKPETIRRSDAAERPADWEIGETAGWETCGTVAEPAAVRGPLAPNRHHLNTVAGKTPVTE
jgi:hypothetical protein